MIKGLYETHLFVADLERAIDFYRDIMGLVLCRLEEERRIAFFWIGEDKGAMLGLWEKPEEELGPRHFAFRCEQDFILNKSVEFLKNHDMKPYNFLKNGSESPMVFAWMPALAIYFDDPDGNALEFIAVLEGEGKPDLEVVSYEEWILLKAR